MNAVEAVEQLGAMGAGYEALHEHALAVALNPLLR